MNKDLSVAAPSNYCPCFNSVVNVFRKCFCPANKVKPLNLGTSTGGIQNVNSTWNSNSFISITMEPNRISNKDELFSRRPRTGTSNRSRTGPPKQSRSTVSLGCLSSNADDTKIRPQTRIVNRHPSSAEIASLPHVTKSLSDQNLSATIKAVRQSSRGELGSDHPRPGKFCLPPLPPSLHLAFKSPAGDNAGKLKGSHKRRKSIDKSSEGKTSGLLAKTCNDGSGENVKTKTWTSPTMAGENKVTNNKVNLLSNNNNTTLQPGISLGSCSSSLTPLVLPPVVLNGKDKLSGYPAQNNQNHITRKGGLAYDSSFPSDTADLGNKNVVVRRGGLAYDLPATNTTLKRLPTRLPPIKLATLKEKKLESEDLKRKLEKAEKRRLARQEMVKHNTRTCRQTKEENILQNREEQIGHAKAKSEDLKERMEKAAEKRAEQLRRRQLASRKRLDRVKRQRRQSEGSISLIETQDMSKDDVWNFVTKSGDKTEETPWWEKDKAIFSPKRHRRHQSAGSLSHVEADDILTGWSDIAGEK